jgi:hypothetical protein
VFNGIDSRDYSLSEYDSVMNYNSHADTYHYSEGGEFDDWAYIKDHFYVPPTYDLDE